MLIGDTLASSKMIRHWESYMSDAMIEEVFGLINTNLNVVNSKTTKLDSINSHVSMSNLIHNLSNVLTRYKKYSEIGWFGRLFTNETIINANIVLCQFEFKSTMNKGVAIKNNIDRDIAALNEMIEECLHIKNVFQESYDKLEALMNDENTGEYEKNRISRKLNDVLSAMVLVENNIAQIKLVVSNIYAINDKYESIDSILRPALERNIKLSKGDHNLLLGTILK